MFLNNIKKYIKIQPNISYNNPKYINNINDDCDRMEFIWWCIHNPSKYNNIWMGYRIIK
jgi:hypothetical protein